MLFLEAHVHYSLTFKIRTSGDSSGRVCGVENQRSKGYVFFKQRSRLDQGNGWLTCFKSASSSSFSSAKIQIYYQRTESWYKFVAGNIWSSSSASWHWSCLKGASSSRSRSHDHEKQIWRTCKKSTNNVESQKWEPVWQALYSKAETAGRWRLEVFWMQQNRHQSCRFGHRRRPWFTWRCKIAVWRNGGNAPATASLCRLCDFDPASQCNDRLGGALCEACKADACATQRRTVHWESGQESPEVLGDTCRNL